MGEPKPTIVLVDDSREVRLLTKTRLRLSGRFQVLGEGANGADAIALAGEHQPALMLLDVSMPDVDGLGALPRVLEASPDTRVVLYSGFEEQGLVNRAKQLGAAAFIEKSTSAESLVRRLLDVLGQATDDVADSPDTPVSAPVHAGAPAEENALQEHLERFHEVFEAAAIGMGTMTLTGRLVRVNRALATLMRRPGTDLVGVFYGDLTEGHEDQVRSALENIRRGPVDVVQLEHGLAEDSRFVRATLAPVRDSEGRALYLFVQVQDVTTERAAMEELRESEERFRLLVEAVEDYAIFMLDPLGHIVSWNAGAQRSQGYRSDEIIGQHFRVFYPPEVAARKHPEYELGVALREGHYEEEGWRLRKDGSRFWANVLITAVFNHEGKHIGFAKVTRDMTARRNLEQERENAVRALASMNAELETLNNRLQEAAEDQAQFLAVTAHELRTPIGVLGGSAETLAQHWTELTEEEREEMLEGMQSSTARLRRLLSDLLTASRLQASALNLQADPVDVSSAVATSVSTLQRTWPDAEVVVDVEEHLVACADQDRLAQMLDNLIGNALRHGAPPVRVTAVHRGTDIELRVSDSGPGVADAIRPRLFERFATGREKGGTGLGLFIVRELARAQGGDAVYEAGPSREAPGAFVITLPADSAPRKGRMVHTAPENP